MIGDRVRKNVFDVAPTKLKKKKKPTKKPTQKQTQASETFPVDFSTYRYFVRGATDVIRRNRSTKAEKKVAQVYGRTQRGLLYFVKGVSSGTAAVFNTPMAPQFG
jgi:hypothetical protein